MKKLVLLLTVSAAVVLAVPLAANAVPANPQVRSVWKATATWVRSLHCVSQARIRQLDDSGFSGARAWVIWGLTARDSRRVYLDQRICGAIVSHNTQYVQALTIIGHEASHARGVHGEAKAECYGARFAYAYLNKTGELADYGASRIRQFLLNDSVRPRGYKLDGRCSLEGTFRWAT